MAVRNPDIPGIGAFLIIGAFHRFDVRGYIRLVPGICDLRAIFIFRKVFHGILPFVLCIQDYLLNHILRFILEKPHRNRSRTYAVLIICIVPYLFNMGNGDKRPFGCRNCCRHPVSIRHPEEEGCKAQLQRPGDLVYHISAGSDIREDQLFFLRQTSRIRRGRQQTAALYCGCAGIAAGFAFIFKIFVCF